MNRFSPENWREYELLDCGGFEKLERFGDQILLRPEPQAVWDKSLSPEAWRATASCIFHKEKGDAESGEWRIGKNGRKNWTIAYRLAGKSLTFRLQLGNFKHIGIFPEQAANWDYVYEAARRRTQPKMLNLFAYTGIASVGAKMAGADVVHVEAVKKVVGWARENMEINGFDGIRWVVEDAVIFCNREATRGKQYDGIVLDPPAYGRGPKGEKWVLETMLNDLLKTCSRLLKPDGFLVLNLYSMGFSPLIGENLTRQHFHFSPEIGELFVADKHGKKLPLGTFARFDKLPG